MSHLFTPPTGGGGTAGGDGDDISFGAGAIGNGDGTTGDEEWMKDPEVQGILRELNERLQQRGGGLGADGESLMQEDAAAEGGGGEVSPLLNPFDNGGGDISGGQHSDGNMVNDIIGGGQGGLGGTGGTEKDPQLSAAEARFQQLRNLEQLAREKLLRPSTAGPGDDYDAYINQEWRRKNSVPPNMIAWGSFLELQHDNLERAKKVCEENPDSLPGVFYRKVMAIPDKIPKEAKAMVEDISSPVSDLASYWRQLAEMVKRKGGNPWFSVVAMPDPKATQGSEPTPEATTHHTSLSGGTSSNSKPVPWLVSSAFTLPDPEWYFQENQGNPQFDLLMRSYKMYIQRICNLFGFAVNPQDVLDVERGVAEGYRDIQVEIQQEKKIMRKAGAGDDVAAANPNDPANLDADWATQHDKNENEKDNGDGDSANNKKEYDVYNKRFYGDLVAQMPDFFDQLGLHGAVPVPPPPPASKVEKGTTTHDNKQREKEGSSAEADADEEGAAAAAAFDEDSSSQNQKQSRYQYLKDKDTVLVDYPQQYDALPRIFHKIGVDGLKQHMIFKLCDALAPIASKNTLAEHFQFHSTILNGQTDKPHPWKRAVELTNGLFGDELAERLAHTDSSIVAGLHHADGQNSENQQLQTDRNQIKKESDDTTPKARAATSMVNDIVGAMRRALEQNTWMTEPTRKLALKKLDRMDVVPIGQGGYHQSIRSGLWGAPPTPDRERWNAAVDDDGSDFPGDSPEEAAHYRMGSTRVPPKHDYDHMLNMIRTQQASVMEGESLIGILSDLRKWLWDRQVVDRLLLQGNNDDDHGDDAIHPEDIDDVPEEDVLWGTTNAIDISEALVYAPNTNKLALPTFALHPPFFLDIPTPSTVSSTAAVDESKQKLSADSGVSLAFSAKQANTEELGGDQEKRRAATTSVQNEAAAEAKNQQTKKEVTGRGRNVRETFTERMQRLKREQEELDKEIQEQKKRAAEQGEGGDVKVVTDHDQDEEDERKETEEISSQPQPQQQQQPPPTEEEIMALAYNYGAIGSLVGRSLTNGFDIGTGRRYDAEGNAGSDWWNIKDIAKYTQEAIKVRDQYAKIEQRKHAIRAQKMDALKAQAAAAAAKHGMSGGGKPGPNGYTPEEEALLAMDPSLQMPIHNYSADPLTITESMADIGGLQLALAAFESRVAEIQAGGGGDGGSGKSNTKNVEIAAATYRKFFEGFASAWRFVVAMDYQAMYLQADPRPQPALRINIAVANVPQWYKAHGVDVDGIGKEDGGAKSSLSSSDDGSATNKLDKNKDNNNNNNDDQYDPFTINNVEVNGVRTWRTPTPDGIVMIPDDDQAEERSDNSDHRTIDQRVEVKPSELGDATAHANSEESLQHRQFEASSSGIQQHSRESGYYSYTNQQQQQQRSEEQAKLFSAFSSSTSSSSSSTARIMSSATATATSTVATARSRRRSIHSTDDEYSSVSSSSSMMGNRQSSSLSSSYRTMTSMSSLASSAHHPTTAQHVQPVSSTLASASTGGVSLGVFMLMLLPVIAAVGAAVSSGRKNKKKKRTATPPRDKNLLLLDTVV